MMPDHCAPWRNPRALAVLLLVFLSGAVVGAMVSRSALLLHARANTPSWKEGGKEISLQRFKKELNLTPEQAQQVETVLDDFMSYYQTLQGQMDEVRANGKERILRILREDQRQKFERMLSDLQARQLR
jgi:Spy/CpxP family protein refolding chaperone